LQLVERYGVDTMTEAMKRTIDYTESRVRKVIQHFPDGTYEFEDYLDGDGGEPIKIKVKLQITGDSIIADFEGSAKQVYTQPINAVISIAHAGTYLPLMGLIDPDIQRNHGCFRPITIKAPEGCIVNAQVPAPVAGGNTEACSRIINTVLGAMAQVVPDRIISTESDGAYNISVKGNEPDTGKIYAAYPSTLTGGWSGRATKDGLHLKSLRGGKTGNTPTEVFELRYPWRIEELRLVTDSGGPGKWRGGLSEEWRFRPLGHTFEMTTNMSRLDVPPYGVFGGMPGLHTALRAYRGYKDPHAAGDDLQGDKVDIYPGRTGGVHVAPEDLLFVRTCGGGGFGNPYERDPELVLEDVLQEYVSLEAAKRDYGVVITSDMKLDFKATEKLRAELKAKNKREQLFVDQATPPYAATPFRQIKMAELPKPIRQHIITTLKEVGHTVTDEK
jgi:N-methylhydantoinase B